jgi:tetratricopeptide (TPR) repeat protein
MRKIFLGALILFFAVSVPKETAAWEAGPTGMCCDADGNCGPCSDGPAYEPPSGDSGGSGSWGGESGWTPAPQKSNADLALEKNAECTVFHRNREYDSAISCYKAALQLDPSNSVIQDNLKKALTSKAHDTAVKYYNEENWAMAVKYFKEALEACGGKDAIIEKNLHNAEVALKGGELKIYLKKEEEEEAKLAEAKAKINKMLDGLSDDFDGSKKRSAQSSAGGLEFMEASKPVSSKVAKVEPSKHVVEPLTPSASLELKAQRQDLEKQYWDLEDKISKEKDPKKRMEMINSQTYVKSQIGLLEIKILDKYKEELQRPEKEMKIKALLVLAAYRSMHLDDEASLKYLHEALKEAPGDKGIQRAINYINYVKEIPKAIAAGKLDINGKWPVVVDALTYGKGDWNVTFSYLEKAAKDYPDDFAIRDALNAVKGIKSHSGVSESDMARRRNDVSKLTAAAESAMRRDDFGRAYKMLQLAADLDPHDVGVRDGLHFTLGVLGERTGMLPAKEEPTALDVANLSRPWREDVDKLVTKGFENEINHKYEEALKSFRQAHALDPEDITVRDEMNYLEGVCSERRSKAKQKNNAAPQKK